MRLSGPLCVCLIALAGCDSNPSQPTPATCTFSLSSASVSMGSAGGAGSVTVTTGSACAWTGLSNVSWITATSGAAVTGPGTFSFTVAAAPDTTARAGTLTVAGQGVSVSQQGQACSYAVSPSSMTFGAAGGSTSFNVTTSSGCGWTATASATWLTVTSGASGSGNGAVTVVAAANPDQPSRTATLMIANQTATITQAGLSACTVTLQPDDEIFGVAGGAATFDVTAASGCEWAIVSNATWVTITDPAGGFGTGSRRVSYSVAANAGDAARTGTMTVGGQTFVVTQAGTASCEYSVAPVDHLVCMNSSSGSITVTTGTGCPWASSSAASWLTISSGASGYGTGRITFTFGYNYDGPARQGTVEVRWPTPTAGQNVHVTQKGCKYSIGPDSFNVPAAGGDYHFSVMSGADPAPPPCGGPFDDWCVWSAVSSASWVTVLSSMPQSGYDFVFFRVAANGTVNTRSATITVRDKTVLIRQAGS